MKLDLISSGKLKDLLKNDDCLYHYTKKSTAIEHILCSKTLKLSSFKNTNDPHEYNNSFSEGIIWNPNTRIHQDIFTTINKYIKNSIFSSFCKNTYRENILESIGCAKSRMWSQYGDDHSSVCFVFSKKCLEHTIQSSISSDERMFMSSVEYFNLHELPYARFKYNNEARENTGHEHIFFNHILENYKSIFFSKHIDYQDENEFRFVISSNYPEKKAKTDCINIESSLKAIILGDRFPNVYLPSINSLISHTNCLCGKLTWGYGGYTLLEC